MASTTGVVAFRAVLDLGRGDGPPFGFALASILILNMEIKDDVALKGDNPHNAARENSA
jgi:hypothetical protein